MSLVITENILTDSFYCNINGLLKDVSGFRWCLLVNVNSKIMSNMLCGVTDFPVSQLHEQLSVV